MWNTFQHNKSKLLEGSNKTGSPRSSSTLSEENNPAYIFESGFARWIASLHPAFSKILSFLGLRRLLRRRPGTIVTLIYRDGTRIQGQVSDGSNSPYCGFCESIPLQVLGSCRPLVREFDFIELDAPTGEITIPSLSEFEEQKVPECEPNGSPRERDEALICSGSARAHAPRSHEFEALQFQK